MEMPINARGHKMNFRALTLAEILDATKDGTWSGPTLYVINNKGDKACAVRMNGRPKRWKRDTSRFELPVKHGIYSAVRLDNSYVGRILTPTK